jgi:peptidoglycan hydrolase-like protein with peptidoglycan-binding domain
MCDNKIAGNKCPNRLIEVSNLQILLNADRNLNVSISSDGKWGKGTQQAVIAFQKRYGITPASGYVGARTKRMLDRVAGAMVARATLPAAASPRPSQKSPKASTKTPISSWQDMCTKTDTDTCPNRPQDVRGLQAFLNKALHLKLTVDGQWGRGTQKAVIQFQKKNHISPASGYVGRKTRTIMQHVARKPRARISRKPIRHAIRSYADFRKYTDYPRTYKVYKDAKLLARAVKSNTRVKIDVSEQRLRLYVHNKVALDSPCTTGAKRKLEPNTHTIRDKSTPKGTFRITEKLANKRSTIFGDIYRNGKKIYHGDRRKYKGSWKGVTFVGHTLKNWMRLTSSGIGLHASRYIKRHPGSNGCIRLPYTVARVVFKKVKPGTPVRIVN